MATTSSNDLRGWRRAFTGIYLAYTLGACLLAFFSILFSLTRERPVKLTGPAIRPSSSRHLLLCQRDLGILLEDLHRHAFDLQARALDAKVNLADEWARYAQKWRDRWAEVGRRCRLSELGGDARYPAIGLLAQAHAEMDELEHVYSALLRSFVERHGERLQSVREKLREARETIRKPAGS